MTFASTGLSIKNLEITLYSHNMYMFHLYIRAARVSKCTPEFLLARGPNGRGSDNEHPLHYQVLHFAAHSQSPYPALVRL